jgi:hypothetical protein
MLYWVCWQELSPSRQRSMGGAAGIPFSEICAWMDERGVVGCVERNIAIELVQRMDNYYLKRLAERAKAESDAK